MEGADCAEAEGEEQAVLLIDDVTGAITVVQVSSRAIGAARSHLPTLPLC